MQLNQGKKTILILFGIVLFFAALAFIFVENNQQQHIEKSEIALLVDDTTYTDLRGEGFQLQDFLGKVVVVNVWATWCPFCVQELPMFEQLAKQFSEDELVVVAINRKESQAKVDGYLSTLSKMNNIRFLLDQNDSYYRSIGGFAMPETIFYSKSGAVVVHKRGPMGLSEMIQHVETARAAE